MHRYLEYIQDFSGFEQIWDNASAKPRNIALEFLDISCRNVTY